MPARKRPGHPKSQTSAIAGHVEAALPAGTPQHQGIDLRDWLYEGSVRRTLAWELEGLKADLDSENPESRQVAITEIEDVLAWLYPPPEPFSAEERLRQSVEVLTDESLTPAERLSAVRRTARATGRKRGRPRTDTAQHAIEALELHLNEPLSWRQIALKVKGCAHVGTKADRSCKACGDAIRDAVGRLEKFLRSKGYHSKLPRRIA